LHRLQESSIELILMAVIKKFKAVKISQNHLLGIQDLSFSEVSYILDEAKTFIKLNKSKIPATNKTIKSNISNNCFSTGSDPPT